MGALKVIALVAIMVSMMEMTHAEADCRDLTFKCHSWKKYCWTRRMYMELNCKDTCGWCPKCQDEAPNCTPEMCRDQQKKTNCRRTCGVCETPTTESPPPETTPPWVVKPAGRCGTRKLITEVAVGDSTKSALGKIEAKKGAWPWQVLIQFYGEPYCGGSLISSLFVVTAATCVHGKEALMDKYSVVTGEHDFNVKEGTETTIHLSKIIAHEKYTLESLDYDIALLKLSRPALFDKRVGTICLPEAGSEVPIGTECVLTGWGRTSGTGSMFHNLQKVRMPVVSNLQCSKLNTANTNIKVTDRMLCAGYGPGKPNSGCHGDTGGPLSCFSHEKNQWFLQGVVSWGSSKCDTKDAYTVLARVGKLRDWIDQNMSQE